jgi:hypothetical protein
MADSVDEFAESFGRMAGLTTAEAQAVLATTGAIAQGLGFSADASAALSQDIVQLAGDLASFNNLPTEDTARAIQAALTGEREQLKRLGIVVRQVDVDQRALLMSGKESVTQVTDQERATATLQIITERAGQAVGDLSRTQDSAANRARQVSRDFRQLAEDLSVQLIPVLESVIPILENVAAGFAGIIPKITEFVTTLSDAVGLTNAAIRTESEAIENANLTIEQLQARQLMIRNELVAATEKLVEAEEDVGFLDRALAVQGFETDRITRVKELREELVDLGEIEETILGLIERRAEQEEQLAEQAERRVQAQTEAAEAAIEFPEPELRLPERGIDLAEMPVPLSNYGCTICSN